MQSKAAHTPGPWEECERGRSKSHAVRAVKDGVYVAHIYEIGRQNLQRRFAETDANARLIAASPELLEALEAVLKLMDDGILVRDTRNDDDPAWAIKQLPLVSALKKADEARRKAKGEL